MSRARREGQMGKLFASKVFPKRGLPNLGNRKFIATRCGKSPRYGVIVANTTIRPISRPPGYDGPRRGGARVAVCPLRAAFRPLAPCEDACHKPRRDRLRDRGAKPEGQQEHHGRRSSRPMGVRRVFSRPISRSGTRAISRASLGGNSELHSAQRLRVDCRTHRRQESLN